MPESLPKGQSLAHSQGYAFYVVDASLQIRWVNQAAAAILHTPTAQLIGRPCCQALQGYRLSPSQCPAKRALSARRIITSFIHLDGQVRRLEAHPLYGSQGEPSGALVLIHEQGPSPARLSHYELFAERSSQGIWEIDARYATVYVNQAMAAMLGYAQEEMVGASLLSFVPETDREGAQRLLHRWMSSPTPQQRMALTRKDGSLCHTLVHAGPLGHKQDNAGALAFVTDITAEKEATECVRFLADLLEKSSQAFGVCDSERRLTLVNDAFCQLTGYSRAELIGKDYFELMPKKWHQKTKQSDKRARRTLKPVRYEKEFQRKDGTVVPVELLIHVNLDQKGAFESQYAFVTDITERKQAQEKLEGSYHRFHGLAELLPEVVFETDTDNRLTYVNKKAFQLFGYTPREMATGLSGFQMIVPGERERAHENFAHRCQGEDMGPVEYTGLRKDGSTFPLLLHMNPIEKGGKVLGFRGVIVDITKQKHREQALQEQEQRLSLALQGADLGTWDWNLQTDKVIFDEQWAKMKGYRLDELEPHLRAWEQLVHPEDLPHAYEKLNQHLAGKTNIYEAEFRMKHKSGQWMWIRDKGKVLEWDEEERPLRACGTHLDITAYKRTQERSELLASLLEKSSQPFAIARGDRHLFMVNDAFCRLLGYTAEELTGLDYFTLTPKKWHPATRRAHQTAYYTGQPVRYEKEFQRKDGSLVPVEVFVHIELDAQGSVKHRYAFYTEITERKQAERLLKRQEERLSLALQGADLGTWDWDLRTNEQVWNERSAEIIGYRLSELKPHYETWKELVHPEDLPRARERFAQHRRGEAEFYEADMRLRHKAGHWVWVHSQGKITAWDEEGRPRRASGIHRDITAYKEQAERAEFFANALLSSSQAFSVGYADGRVRRVNQAYCRLLGYTQEEVEKLNWRTDLTPPKWRRVSEEHLQRAIETRRPQRFEKQFLRKDGTRVDVDVKIHPVFDEEGEFQYQYAFLTDITERKKQTERAEFLASLVDRTSQPFAVADPSGRFTFFNNAFCRLLGYTREEVRGLSFSSLTPRKWRAATQQAHRRAYEDKVPVRYEKEYRRKDGSLVPLEVLVELGFDAEGSVKHRYAFYTDITERKRAEAERQAHTQEQKTIAEATLQLTRLEAIPEICNLLASTLRQLAGPVHVAIFLYEPDIDKIRLQSLAGLTKKEREQISALGCDPDELVLARDMVDATRRLYESRSLEKLSGGLRELTGDATPKELCEGLERICNVGSVYMIGFTLGDRPYGAACICAPPGRRPAHQQAIEMLTHHFSEVLQRRQTQEQVRKSEHQYRLLANNTTDIIWTMDFPLAAKLEEAALTYVSPSIKRLTGFAVEEVLHMPLGKMITPDSLHQAMQVFRQDRRQERAEHLLMQQTVEFEQYCKDGSTLWIECNFSILRDEEGSPIGLIGTSRDITQRKERERALSAARQQAEQALLGTIEVVRLAVEKRDPYTAGHQERVAELSAAIAKRIGLPDDQVQGIELAAQIHDIGKIQVPAEILTKPTQLTEAEIGLMRLHPESGYEIVRSVDFPWPIAEMIRQHHERVDGSGYPRGLQGSEINQGARILAVADVTEAMASHRPYRPARGLKAALAEIKAGAGTRYDERIAHACLQLFEKEEFSFSE